MSKKLSVIFLTVCIAMVLLVPARVVQAESGDSPKAKGFLRNLDTGQRIEIPVKMRSENIGNGRYRFTFVAEVLKKHVKDPSKTVTKNDGSVSARLTLEQVYNQIGNNIAIDYYRGVWELLDGSVWLNNANTRAACNGYWAYKSGFCNLNEQNWVGAPSLGTSYYQYPSWRNEYVTVNGINYQAGWISVTLHRGGSTWDFAFCVSQGGSSGLACD